MVDEMAKASNKIEDSKSYVKIKYTVRVADGPILKGAQQPEFMDFVTGYRQVVPGLETRLLGHETGEKLSFSVPPEEAFGPRHQELVIEKTKNDFHFPPGMEPYPGMELPLLTGDGDAPDTVIIREVREDSIVIDANHPLSGATLDYDLEIVEARPARSTDLCEEWDEQRSGNDEPCCSSPHQIILGAQEPEGN
jgi:FKBP-type peptidyl-prolyl cis-trans isomerase SlyD